jgi:hypothetical protein
MSGMSLGSVNGADRTPVVELSMVVYDLGPEPEWHGDRSLFGPWRRYEALLPSYPAVRGSGTTPWDAVRRLVGDHRALLERRWSTRGPAA